MNKLKVWALIFIGLVLGVLFTYDAFSWINSDPQGEANSSCDKFDGAMTANGSGMVVSSHATACSALGTSVVNYVYIHASVKNPTPEQLVFRYSQDGAGDSLKVVWLDERRVVLQVDHVTGISKIKTTSGAISIDYKIQGVRD